MDTKRVVWAGCLTLLLWGCQYSNTANGQFPATPSPNTTPVLGQQFVIETAHFRVMCPDPQFAKEVGAMAEAYRTHLAMHWLGHDLRPWAEKVPLVVHTSPKLPASGETKYTLMGGDIRAIQMTVSGTKERILDSVLPHEMTHTVLATHFAPSGKPVPRWADEGACTTVEHISERSKHDVMLVKFLTDGRGIPFSNLFAMREYPPAPYLMPLYAQSYSLCAFLIAQGGPRRFVQFLEQGMQTDNWPQAVAQSYGYEGLGRLKVAWNAWVSDGGGDVTRYTAMALKGETSGAGSGSANGVVPASSLITMNQQQPSPTVQQAALQQPISPQVSNPQAANPQLGNTQSAVASAKTAGYYQRQFQMNQNAAVPVPLPSSPQLPTEINSPIEVRASQPSTMHTIGGTVIR